MSSGKDRESGADVDFKLALIEAKTILDDTSIPLKKRVADAVTASYGQFRHANNKAATEAYNRMAELYNGGDFSEEDAPQIEACIRAALEAISYKPSISPTLKPRGEL